MGEYGNEESCSNCGDEWSPLGEDGLCEECLLVKEGK